MLVSSPTEGNLGRRVARPLDFALTINTLHIYSGDGLRYNVSWEQLTIPMDLFI